MQNSPKVQRRVCARLSRRCGKRRSLARPWWGPWLRGRAGVDAYCIVSYVSYRAEEQAARFEVYSFVCVVCSPALSLPLAPPGLKALPAYSPPAEEPKLKHNQEQQLANLKS